MNPLRNYFGRAVKRILTGYLKKECFILIYHPPGEPKNAVELETNLAPHQVIGVLREVLPQVEHATQELDARN